MVSLFISISASTAHAHAFKQALSTQILVSYPAAPHLREGMTTIPA